VVPEPWPEAGEAPYHNIIGSDPLLIDPEHGDYRPQPGSPAEAYGCQTFNAPRSGGGIRGVTAHRGGSAAQGFNVTCGGIDTGLGIAASAGVQRMARPDTRPVAVRRELRRSPRETILVGGLISSNTVWAADTVLVDQDVVIDNDVTLTIAPGTRVVFQHFDQFRVQGCLLAVGTPAEPVVFTSEHPELFSQDHGRDGAWNGIVFANTLATNDTSRLRYCVIEYSKAVPEILRDGAIYSAAGGALRVANFSKLEIACSVFRHNLADFGGAIYCCYGAAPLLAGNLLTANRALEQGSAMFNAYSYPRLIGNTITGNIVESGLMFLDTGAVDNFHSKPLLVNNVIQGNHTDQYNDMQVWEAKEYYATSNNIGGLVGGTGNIDVDPLFDPEGELPGILTEDSPCVDSGDTELSLPYLLPFDLLGRPRVTGDRIDMGAFEWAGGTPVSETVATAAELHLKCYPNPFNPKVTLTCELPEPGEVTIEIMDAGGRRVAVLLQRHLPAGTHNLIWDGRNGNGKQLPSGVYLGRVTTARTAMARKLVLIR
jgi:hypothetical protein